MNIKLLLKVLLLLSISKVNAKTIELPPAPTSVVAPSISTGVFNVYWSMGSDNNLMLMSAGSNKGVINQLVAPTCPGGCSSTTEYAFVLEQSSNSGPFEIIYQGVAKSKSISMPVGSYRFRVKAKQHNVLFGKYSNYTHSNITTVQNITAPPGNGEGDGSPDENINLDTAMLEGGASVSGGQAAYKVPIVIPPGRNDIMPNISLSYSSASGNGVVGVGWSLNAISSISRCSATYAQDGFLQDITYSAIKDRLCLNGQRLMAVSGVYGQSSTIYRTEIDSFVRVKQFGRINDSYTRFEATYPDGTVAFFGGDTQSRNKHTGAPAIFSWNINLQHDASEKNFIHFEYDNFGAGEQLITDIYYTGNSANSSYKGNRRINFEYADRTDKTLSYVAGGKIEQTQKLSSMYTYVGNKKIRKYNLNFQKSLASNRNLLKSVTLCGFTNNALNCASPTVFDWSDRVAKIKLEPLGVNGQHAFPNISNIDNAVPRGDRNGDGVRDWSGLYVNAEGEFNDSNDLDLRPCQKNIYTRRLDCSEGDFNQDGLTDDWEKVGSTLYLKITNGSNINTGIQLIASNKFGLKPSGIVNIADYNGDSWPDLMVFHDYVGSQNKPKLKLYLHSKNTISPYSAAITVFEYGTALTNNRYSLSKDIQFVGDMSGDGLPDLVQVDTGAGRLIPYAQPVPKVLYKAHSSGTFHTSPLDFGISVNSLSPKFTYFIDINSDGLTDWLGWDERKILIARLNKGNGVFGNEQTLTGDSRSIVSRNDFISHQSGEPDVRYVPKYEAAFKFHDINGDGKTELLMPGRIVLEGCTLISTAFPSSSQSYRCGNELYGTFFSRRNRNSRTSINSSIADQSIYQFDALSFEVKSDGSISVTKKATNLYGHAYQSIIVDAYGNGMPTLVFNHRLKPGAKFIGSATGTPFSGYESNYGIYINRSFGAGTGVTNKDYMPVDLLEKTTNAIGLESQWEYRPLSSGIASALQADIYDVDRNYTSDGYIHFSSSMYVVQNFKQSNGRNSSNETQYAYKGAMYNTQGRGFMGFRSVLEYNSEKDIISHTDFLQKFPYQSKVQYQATFKRSNYPSNIQTLEDYSSNRYVSFTESKWERNSAHQAANSTSVEKCEYDYELKRNYCVMTKGTNAVQHLYLSQSISTSRDIDNYAFIQSSTINQTGIDQCGNMGSIRKIQQDDWGTYQQTSVNDNSDASCNNNGIWWPHKIANKAETKNAVVRSNSNDAFLLYSGNEYGLDKSVTVSTSYEYEHAKIRKPTKITINALSDNSAKPSVTNIIFNNYGLPTQVSMLAKVRGTNTTRLVNRIKYSENGLTEAVSGYFPWETRNALGHINKMQTDISIGKPIKTSQQLSGSNYFDTEYVYDALGRILSTSADNSPTMHIRYTLALQNTDSLATPYSKTVVSSYQAGKPIQKVYHDRVGREVRTATESFSGDWILTDKQYDSLGNTTFESVPKTENANTYGTTYSGFDILGRPETKITHQVCGQLETSYSYSSLNTTITAEDKCAGGKLITMSRSYNSLKQLVQTVDANNGITSYAYNSMGLPIVIRDASNTDIGTIIAKYNDLGRKIRISDPNQGISTFEYNGFGELEKEIQNVGSTSKVEINYTADSLGRTIMRSATGEGTLRYSYDVGSNALGQLYQETGNGVTRTYTYTTDGQLKDTTVSIDNRSYKIQNKYDDTYGRPKGLIYPNELHVSYEYNERGYLTKVKNAASSLVYREITAQDQFGKITAATLGNGVRQTGKYSAKTGQTLALGYSKNNDNVMGISYGISSNSSDGYDGFGNMIKSVAVRGSITNATITIETYGYDTLQRLTANSIQGIQAISYSYDSTGNLLSKSDYANSYDYTSSMSGYSGGGSNAVKRIRKGSIWYGFSYDTRGNLIKGDGLTQATYNSFDKPTLINKNSSITQFIYGPNGMRHKQSKTIAGVNTKTYYVEAMYEEEVSGIHTQWRAYIGDIAIVSGKSSGGISTRYTHKDRLGSALAFTNESGQVVSQRLFDPFGKPRNMDGHSLLVPRLTDFSQTTTHRGFTDHEHLNEAELIHMNGRVYDYNLGRFLSVDPFIQAPGNSQSMNPYSYIMNNPLSGTDPTGYVAKEETMTGSRIPGVDTGASGAGWGMKSGDLSGDTPAQKKQDAISQGITNAGKQASYNGFKSGQEAKNNSSNSTTEINSQKETSQSDGNYASSGNMPADSRSEPIGSHSMGGGMVGGQRYNITATYGIKDSDSNLNPLMAGITGVTGGLVEHSRVQHVLNLSSKGGHWLSSLYGLANTWELKFSANKMNKGFNLASVTSMGKGLGVLGFAWSSYHSGKVLTSIRSSNAEKAKSAVDIAFGAVGFMGLPGFAISASYFALDYYAQKQGGWGNLLNNIGNRAMSRRRQIREKM